MKNNPPENFKEGINVLMLIDRGVQNSNKGSKRWINKIITSSIEDFDGSAEKLIELQNNLNNPDIRLYSSINSRNIKKAIKIFNHKQLDLNEDNEILFYKRINDSFCSCLMQPDCRARSLFLLDCDSKDLSEINSFVISNNELKVHYQYPTPNGWHYIIDPFNPQLCEDKKTFEIKKDALMLLNWIDEVKLVQDFRMKNDLLP